MELKRDLTLHTDVKERIFMLGPTSYLLCLLQHVLNLRNETILLSKTIDTVFVRQKY